MTNVIVFAKAHYGVILSVLAFLVNDLINSLHAYPKAETALHILSDLLSFHQNSDSPGTMKMLFKRSIDPKKLTPLATGTPVVPAGIMLLIGAMMLVSCSYCAQQVHKNDLSCKVAAVSAKCGEPAVFKIVLQILPQVIGDLVSGDYGAILTSLITTLEQQGVADAAGIVTCAVQQADGNLPADIGKSMNPNLIIIKTHAQLWLGARK